MGTGGGNGESDGTGGASDGTGRGGKGEDDGSVSESVEMGGSKMEIDTGSG